MSWYRQGEPQVLAVEARSALRTAALDRAPISGLTHRFYRYPARFSPVFARNVIGLFSNPGDIVLDPYMGGGTTVVEAMVSGRRGVGNDINSLAVFVASVKTTRLDEAERQAVQKWIRDVVPTLSYRTPLVGAEELLSDRRTKNLNMPRARGYKKVIAVGLERLELLPTEKAQRFVRCALLNTAQLFLNGRSRVSSAESFRKCLVDTGTEMLTGMAEFSAAALGPEPVLVHGSASSLGDHMAFASGSRADLVVTSPPYPGIHMLYHRWQVDGRKESPAPYWLANCQDGQGNAFYNFADRRPQAEDEYFRQSLLTLQGIRSVMKSGALIVQMIAFSDPDRQIRRYLRNMEEAGFSEVRASRRRIWRDVPSRRWHAHLKGKLNGSREVVLIHMAN